MTARGVWSVVGVECTKLSAQVKARIVMAACVLGPFAFAAVIRLQSSLPEDTLFGRAVRESGFAVPLVILGFAALWAFPVIGAIVGGDVFSAEDRYGTWTTLLTRSRSRTEVFTGKVIAALAFSLVAVCVLAASSMAAGALVVGTQPMVNLSGSLVEPSLAAGLVALAWLTVLPPAFAFTALAVLVSVVARSSVAGIAVPVAVASAMQLSALVDGPEPVRRLLITSAFGAWHGLLTEPRYYEGVVHGCVASAIYSIVCLACAYSALRRRDIA